MLKLTIRKTSVSPSPSCCIDDSVQRVSKITYVRNKFKEKKLLRRISNDSGLDLALVTLYYEVMNWTKNARVNHQKQFQIPKNLDGEEILDILQLSVNKNSEENIMEIQYDEYTRTLVVRKTLPKTKINS